MGTTTGIIHIMLDTTILARDQLMLSQNHIGEDMVDTVDMVDITGVRTTKDSETDLSRNTMNSFWNSCTKQLANILGCKFLDISCLIFFLQNSNLCQFFRICLLQRIKD